MKGANEERMDLTVAVVVDDAELDGDGSNSVVL